MDYTSNYSFGSDVSVVFKKEIFPLLRNLKVLDLGCGTGEYLQHFGQDSLGLDISPKNLDKAKKEGLRVKKCDLQNPINVKEKFDAVFISHLLEHMENPIELLRFANSCLKDNGILVLSIPNEISIMHLKYPYYEFKGNHLYGFTINNIYELLEYTGFDVDKIRFDFYTALTRKLGINNLIRILNLLPRPLKSRFAWAFWFVAKKKI
jgi:SAM-dependent methyltransferase